MKLLRLWTLIHSGRRSDILTQFSLCFLVVLIFLFVCFCIVFFFLFCVLYLLCVWQWRHLLLLENLPGAEFWETPGFLLPGKIWLSQNHLSVFFGSSFYHPLSFFLMLTLASWKLSNSNFLLFDMHAKESVKKSPRTFCDVTWTPHGVMYFNTKGKCVQFLKWKRRLKPRQVPICTNIPINFRQVSPRSQFAFLGLKNSKDDSSFF